VLIQPKQVRKKNLQLHYFIFQIFSLLKPLVVPPPNPPTECHHSKISCKESIIVFGGVVWCFYAIAFVCEEG
jgi:hypothetical protein